MGFNYDEYIQSLKVDENIIARKGYFTIDEIKEIVSLLKTKLIELKETRTTRNNIAVIAIEMLQNLYDHGRVSNDSHHYWLSSNNMDMIFIIRKEGPLYTFTSGSFIVKDHIKFLKRKLDIINSLDKETELNEMYKFIINHQKLSAKGMAGTGLVEMAKKIDDGFKYQFNTVSDDLYFYELKATYTSKSKQLKGGEYRLASR